MSGTLFGGVAPTSTTGGGNPGFEAGIDFTAQHTGQVDGIFWWQAPAGGPAAVTGLLYDTQTHALVASQASGVLTPNAWNLIPFASPAAVLPGRLYTAAAHVVGNANIGLTAGLIAGHTFSGDLTAPLRTGRFANGVAPAFPALNTGTDAFGVDLQFTETPTCPECPACPPTEGFFINLTSSGLINAVTGVGQCVIDALDQTPAGAPCRQCLLVPSSQIAWDNCGGCDGDGCTGQVALAIRAIYNSDNFPQPANGSAWGPCPPRWIVAQAVVSVTRCLPSLTETGDPPDCAAELAAAVTLENDRTAVRQAIACCLASARNNTPQFVTQYAISPSVTLPESGACGGIETEFFVGVTGSCAC